VLARARVISVAVVCALSGLAAAPAHASRGQNAIFDAGVELTGDLCCPGLSSSALNEARALGARTVRVLVFWRDVVASPDSTVRPPGDPSDPAWAGYAQPSTLSPQSGWGKYDELVKGIVTRGMSVLMVPTGTFPDGRVPRWASNSAVKDGTDPDPGQYGLFLAALAHRYRGGYTPAGGLATLPAVSYVGVWNEPNSPFQLQPQIKNGAPYTPGLYRRLYSAGRQGLLNGGFGGQIWTGELAPRGTNATLGPIPFTEQFLCLQRVGKKRHKKKPRKIRYRASCGALHADGFAHHPHTGIDPPFRNPTFPGDVTVANLGDLQRVLAAAARAGAINPLPLEIDEYGVQTYPPPKLLGVSFQQQAEYIGISEYLGWRNPGVAAWNQYLLRDDSAAGGFTSGLRLHDGTPKPSLDAYRTPLVIRIPCARKGKANKGCAKKKPPKRVNGWGEVRPVGSAHVQILRNAGSGWVAATPQFRTDARGYFQRKLRYRRGRLFKLVWFAAEDGLAGQCGGTCVGPPIRAYRFK
jgi:hypothetical protein